MRIRPENLVQRDVYFPIVAADPAQPKISVAISVIVESIVTVFVMELMIIYPAFMLWHATLMDPIGVWGSDLACSQESAI